MDPSIDDREIDFDVEISLIDPNNKPLEHILTKVKFRRSIRLHRFRFVINGFFMSVPGDYVYRIGIKSSEEESFHPECEIPFFVSEK